jgi:hypothetical protein
VFLLLLPALAGEKVGVRGSLKEHRMRGESPSPDHFVIDLSPQAGRGKKGHAAPSRIGGWNESAVSQGKKIQVSCDTSVMKVSTSGLPCGLA